MIDGIDDSPRPRAGESPDCYRPPWGRQPRVDHQLGSGSSSPRWSPTLGGGSPTAFARASVPVVVLVCGPPELLIAVSPGGFSGRR